STICERRVILPLLVVTAITSVIAILVRGRGLAGFGAALVAALEMVGATAVFFAANLVIGAVLVLGARRLTPIYHALYDVSALALLILSLLQALTVESWRRFR